MTPPTVVTADLSVGSPQATVTGDATDTLDSIENLVGGSAGDTLTGQQRGEHPDRWWW